MIGVPVVVTLPKTIGYLIITIPLPPRPPALAPARPGQFRVPVLVGQSGADAFGGGRLSESQRLLGLYGQVS